MNKFRLIINALAVVIFTVAFASAVNAQATRTWVSGVGDDANPCSRTAPCKTFAGAISKTADKGEIDALDPGGFGTVTITKNITIDGTGTLASILSAGTNGVNVNDSATATPGTIAVTLRGISINGAGSGINGINFTSGKSLNVIDCLIIGVTTNGINISLNQAAQAQLYVVNSHVKKCTGDGVSLTNANAAGLVRADIRHSSFVENGNGLHAKSNSRVVALDSTFSLNSSNGILADAATAATVAAVRVQQSQIDNNGGAGVRAGNGGSGTSAIEIGANQIDFNAGNGALVSTNGLIETFSNNSIHGNGTDGCPSCTNIAPGN